MIGNSTSVLRNAVSSTQAPHVIASGLLFLLSTTVIADSSDWKAIGSDHVSQSEQVNDEWRELGTSNSSSDGWSAVYKQRSDNVGTLVPTLTAVDANVAVQASQQDAVSTEIVEFGSEGSAATLLDSDRIAEGAISETINLDMFVGELKVLGKVDVTRVAIGNGGIVRAEVLKTGELLVIAQAGGSTSFRLWNKDGTQSNYNIRVSEADLETRVRMERMVRMRVRIVEFSKNNLTELGVDWDTNTSGPTFAAAGDALGNNLFRPESSIAGLPNIVEPFSTYFGITSNIASKINFYTQRGEATTLSEPVLSAMNGGEASFLAGGEIPYPSQSESGQPTVDFKEYGIKLKIAPTIDSVGNVRTFLETEVSTIDNAVSVSGAPGLKTRKASTEFNVRSGETIVISGLLTTNKGMTIKSVPGLGSIPFLGKLFRTEKPEENTTELVIFVTPEVVEPTQNANTARENHQYDQSSRRLRSARQQLPLME